MPDRRRRFISIGLTSLAIALLCFAISVVGVMVTFNQVATSGQTPSPRDLASGVSLAMIPSYLGVPLGIAGVILTIVGLLTRRVSHRDRLAAAREQLRRESE